MLQERALREVGFQNTACIGSQLRLVQFFVCQFHHRQSFFDVTGILVTANDFLRTVGRCDISTAFHVITRHRYFVTTQSVHQFGHTLGCIGSVFAVWITLNQLGKRLISIAVGFRVAVGPVLGSQLVQERLVFVKQDQTFQVQRVVHIRMLRMMALEARNGSQGFFRLIVFIIGIRRIQLGLLGIAAVWKTGF